MLQAVALVLTAVVLPVEAEPPTDAEVLRALPPVVPRLPRVHEAFRNDVIIIKEIVAQVAITVPLPGKAPVTVVDTSWCCRVYYTERVETRFLSWIPVRFEQKRVRMVPIRKSHTIQ